MEKKIRKINYFTLMKIIRKYKISSMQQSASYIQKNRVLSLDAFRGMTIVLMILVNNLGSYIHAPAQLLHAKWHGCTLTDMVFPFFLFIMGTTMAFSFNTYSIQKIDKYLLYKKIIKRTIILLGIGIIAHLIPKFDFYNMRLFGVLQRIALCYFIVSFLALNIKVRGQIIVTLMLLTGYWIIMEVMPYPGKGNDSWAFNNNFAQYFDTFLLGKHTWKKGLEPEGIMSTIPAIATTIVGYMTGKLLNLKYSILKKNLFLFLIASILVTISLLWNIVMPMNKQLWTGSYVLFTAGIALYVLGIIYFLIEGADLKSLFSFAYTFGSNSLFIYVLSSLFAKLLYSIPATELNGKTISVKIVVVTFLQKMTGQIAGSVLYALLHVALWFIIASWMYRKKIFIKV